MTTRLIAWLDQWAGPIALQVAVAVTLILVVALLVSWVPATIGCFAAAPSLGVGDPRPAGVPAGAAVLAEGFTRASHGVAGKPIGRRADSNESLGVSVVRPHRIACTGSEACR